MLIRERHNDAQVKSKGLLQTTKKVMNKMLSSLLNKEGMGHQELCNRSFATYAR